jgi:adenylyl cyclase-associated protein
MADVLEAYVAKYGKQPKDHTQLMSFSKKEDDVRTLSFKEAKATMKGASGGASATSAAAPVKAEPKSEPEPEAEPEPVPEAKAEEVEEPEAESGGDADAAVNPLFAELSKGLKVTSGLKKVTDDMKTKYRTDRSGKIEAGAAPSKKAAASAPKKDAPKKKRDPSMAKKGLRWMIEYFTEEEVHTVETDPKTSTREDIFITQCSNCAFIIKDKVKAITIDGCKNVQIQVADVITTVEAINCQKLRLVLTGKVPTIAIDKCSQPKMVMTRACLSFDPKLITSMISDMEVEIEGKTPEEDFKTFIVPYQFESRFDTETGAITTLPVSHSG